MSGRYEHLEDERPRAVRDHTSRWQRLRELDKANERERKELVAFCERKRISLEALAKLGTKVTHQGDKGLCLAYPGWNEDGIRVVAIKYRPINGTSHDSFAEEPSVWLRPIIIGNLASLDWLVAEGETETARLFGLVGDREAFLRVATPRPRFAFECLAEFKRRELPRAEPLLGEPGKVLITLGSLFLVYGADGSGKSTWSTGRYVHLAAGVEWLGFSVQRPVRVLVVENEGPAGLFRERLLAKLEAWSGPDPTEDLFVYAAPWGDFTFADAGARAELIAYCESNRIELVVANPTLGLRVGASGRPNETAEFVDWLRECGLDRDRAFWLIHHQNKSGQISGDWGRHPDTYAQLQRDGNRQRSKLTWVKPRWATLEPAERTVMLEWETESWGYRAVPLEVDGAGATDEELDARIRELLTAHPFSPTRQVIAGVEGSRERIRERLDAKFDCARGPKNALLWLNPAATLFECADGSAATVPRSEENADG